jgi:hypothetical protein
MVTTVGELIDMLEQYSRNMPLTARSLLRLVSAL